MKYKEFKKKLIDLNISNKEFCSIFSINQSTTYPRKDGKVSKMVQHYILMLEIIGIEKTKEAFKNIKK